ncbi:MAG: hypothetical protein F9K19_18715 [Rhizobiaceae bacterium]|nr:MAG: hypothetical protein F9K19_18715 [Rhizobiaceae bacterium]
MFYIPRFRRTACRPADAEMLAAWRRDPLSHPVLSAMNERELADLPLGHQRINLRSCEAGSSAG